MIGALGGILQLDGARPSHDTARALVTGRHDVAGTVCNFHEAGPCLLAGTGAVAEAGSLAATFDGALFNRRDIAAALREPLGTDDAMLVLKGYAKWGESLPEHLVGEFALAVWDGDERRLFCATDATGGCPIYYTLQRDFAAFASAEESLLAVPGVAREPDELLVAHLFIPELLPDDGSHTWLREVKVLEAGECLSLRPGSSPRRRKYWQWQPSPLLRFGSEREAAEAFREVFATAVHDRVKERDRVGQLLSGGMDSACVVSALAQERPRGWSTYSVVGDRERSIETQCIEVLQASAGSAHVAIRMPEFTGPLDADEACEEVWARSHPRDNSMIVPLLAFAAARANGEVFVLHGACGDVTTSTPDRYASWLMRHGQWRAAWRECRLAARHHTYLRGTPVARLVAANAWTAWAPAPLRHHVVRARAGQAVVPDFLQPAFVESLRVRERLLEAQSRRLASRLSPSTPQEDQAELLNGIYGPSAALAGYASLARRFGIRASDPWGDPRVVDFFLRLPLEWKVREGWTKFVARASCASRMPSQVVWRSDKEHLAASALPALLKRSGARLEELLLGPAVAIASRYIDPSAASAIFRRFRASGTGGFPAEPDLVYHLATVVAWLNRLAPSRYIC